MKFDTKDVHSRCQRHTKGLNAPIQVLIIQGILIVPDGFCGGSPCYFVTHEPDTIVSGVRLNLVHCRAPYLDGRLLSHRGAYATKTKGLVDSGHSVLTVRSVVVHVALAGVRLAPGVFMRDHILRFGKIRRPKVQRRVQVINVNQNSVRSYVMNVAAVIVRC